MATCYCECGAKYRVPDNSLGKHAKCKKCGAVFTLKEEDDGPIPLADGWDDAIEQSAAARPIPSQADQMPPPGSPAAAAAAPYQHGPVSAIPVGPRTYWTNVLWSFLFLSNPSDLISFIVIAGLLIVTPMIPFAGWFLHLLLIGWFAAFRFNIVASAAAGEERLPDVEMSSDYYADIIEPFFRWIASWIVVLAPAIAYLIYAWQQGRLTGTEVGEVLVAGLTGLWQGTSSGVTTFDFLLCAGMAMWPMVILCLALGGFECLFRPDLMILTIARTLPAYAVTLALMFAITLAIDRVSQLATSSIAAPAGGSIGSMIGNALLLGGLITGLSVYLDIVLMRLIGLYYHHHKSRFAWDWG
jgi:hypothetical protein